jgi:hypothetical protein
MALGDGICRNIATVSQPERDRFRDAIIVTDWLRGLGLEQYARAFHDNAIDGEILRELTADDLEDLGVSLVGHRRKLLAAIAALRDDPPISGAWRPNQRKGNEALLAMPALPNVDSSR